MNSDIVNIFKNSISGLAFVDKIAGMVRPVVKIDNTMDENGNESFVRKVFPVACDVSKRECEEQGKYTDLVPNDLSRSIIYFEDRGSVLSRINGNLFIFTSNIRLVCWYSMRHLSATDCSWSAPIIASMMLNFPTDNFNSGNYQRLNIVSFSVAPKSPDIFSTYTYSEETNQYLLYPYDYFALDLVVEFAINKNCIEDLTNIVPEC